MKSCATPPASWPTACIFWDWTNCASRVLSLGRVREDGQDRRLAVENGPREGDLQEDLLSLGLAARDLRAAERASLGGILQALRDRAGETLDEVADLRSGDRAFTQKLSGGLVGVGERAAGFETRERDRQVLEEVVRHKTGDLGAVERVEQNVPRAV